MIPISDTFALPLDIITQTIAIIGKKGSGKTYTASGIGESMSDSTSRMSGGKSS